MHYYKRNIGDYAKKAGRLTMLQHGAYTLLIDACYDRERFPTLDEAIDWTWASTEGEIEAVKFVLSKFFTVQSGVYVQNHIHEDLIDYQQKAETNKRIATEREARRTERARSVDGNGGKGNEPPPNHKPLTTNHKPEDQEQTPSGEAPPAGGPPVEQKPIDPIWGTGLAFLVRKGIPEKQARSLIGKLRNAAGDVQTGAILAKADEDDISDPAPWLMAAAQKTKATGKPSAAADFRNTTYTGTPYDELPPELR